MQEASYFQLLNPLIMAIFATGFVLIWRGERSMRSALYFATAYTCGAIGFVIDFAVRDAIGLYWGQYASNVWLLAIPALVTCGLAERYARPKPWLAVLAIYVGTFAVVSAFLFVWPHSGLRAVAMNAGPGLMLCLTLPMLWRRYDKSLSRILFWIMTLTIAQFFIRPALVLAYSGLATEQVSYSNSLYALTLHLTSAICAISLAATLLFALGIDMVRRLHELGQTDPLTGLLDRRGLQTTFNELPHERLACSVILTDIDRFKVINDRFGHATGDQVISAFASLLRDETRPDDVVARIGGEEFVIVLPGTPLEVARMRAEAIRTAFATTTISSAPEQNFTASFGVAELRRGEPLNGAVNAADLALYRAKREGRDRVYLADDEPELPDIAAS